MSVNCQQRCAYLPDHIISLHFPERCPDHNADVTISYCTVRRRADRTLALDGVVLLKLSICARHNPPLRPCIIYSEEVADFRHLRHEALMIPGPLVFWQEGNIAIDPRRPRGIPPTIAQIEQETWPKWEKDGSLSSDPRKLREITSTIAQTEQETPTNQAVNQETLTNQAVSYFFNFA